MSLTDRDRKILFGLLPILILAAYWFLVLAPKREEAASAEQSAAKQEQRADTARAQVAQANRAETDFASDYGEIVRLGKAVPAQVDMPSLIVQLDKAAEGTGIRFTKIATGDRTTSGTAPLAAPAPPSAASGEQAQSAPGAAAESANNAAASSGQRNAAAEQSGVSPADAQTSTSSGQGLPVATSSVAGLETVPLELEFTGDFFHLADFFHDVKRFVHTAGTSVVVGGRLITIEGVNYASDPELFPKIKAELKATIYLSPKAEASSAGATPAGPPSTTPASTPAAVEDSAPAAPAPTAVATP